MKQIPNIFTLANLFFGCMAIVQILQNGISIQFTPMGDQFIDIPESIWIASLFIALAAVIDFFDGFVARALGASSEMGKQLDSLADVVSFGVAPGMIMYQFLRLSWASEPSGIDVSWWVLMPAFLIPCAAAYRLAKFNIDEGQQFSFKGVPTPAVGLLIASFPVIYWTSQHALIVDIFKNKWFLYGAILAVSYLMICNWPIQSLKFKEKNLQSNWPKLLLAALALLSALLFKWLAVPIVFLAYIVVSLLLRNRSN